MTFIKELEKLIKSLFNIELRGNLSIILRNKKTLDFFFKILSYKKVKKTTEKENKKVSLEPKQIKLPILTSERIISVLNYEWQNIKNLISKLKIKDIDDARYLKLKLKELERKNKLKFKEISGISHWRLKILNI